MLFDPCNITRKHEGIKVGSVYKSHQGWIYLPDFEGKIKWKVRKWLEDEEEDDDAEDEEDEYAETGHARVEEVDLGVNPIFSFSDL